MMNKEEYNFDDFTHTHYRELLLSAKSSYEFISYQPDLIKERDSFILWRHDIDFSVHEAFALAHIEHELNIKATYFLLPHSEYYNFWERSIFKKINKIIQLGHHIGLHFDPLFYNIKSKDKLEEKIFFEKNIIEKIFDVKINAFSFHNPTAEILLFDEWSYAGLINTYAKEIKSRISYCSDSNGYWRFSRLYDVLTSQKPSKLQVLTHPEWWTEKIMSPKEKIWRCADRRAEKNKSYYQQVLEAHDRKIIDW